LASAVLEHAVRCVAAAVCLLGLAHGALAEKPALRNPGLPARWSMDIRDYLDAAGGYVTAHTTVSLVQEAGRRYVSVACREGDYYSTEIRLNYADLTTVWEKRTDLRSQAVVEQYAWVDRDHVRFTSARKPLDREFHVADRNIYSRYAYLVSLMGFPFDVAREVHFSTFSWEYGDALCMHVRNLGPCWVMVTAGGFNCYKLEISVGSWQGVFSRDKFYLYLTQAPPHHFVRYDEPGDNGRVYTNELMSYTAE
jgi:hypothetical protein